MSWSAKCSWKPDTPGSEPAGARISAGKSGSVARSLPSCAVTLVKRSPVNCMPSPESPANRMVTVSTFWTVLVVIPLHCRVVCRRANGSTCDIVYLDHASATPWHPAALAAYAAVAEQFPADPTRRHAAGRAARDLLESARSTIASTFEADADRI